MNNNAYGDIIAELEAIMEAEPVVLSPRDLALLEELDAIQVPDSEKIVEPNFVADGNHGAAHYTEGGKGEPCLVASPGQCADQLSSNLPDTTSYIINVRTLRSGKSHRSFLTSEADTSSSLVSSSIIERIARRKPTSSANTLNDPVRKPRRKAAQLNEVARKKTWDGTKSKNRKDRINDKEKLAAAVWHAATAGGVAVSLNLGIRREGMLLNHDDPRRRMMQNLHKQLSAVGLSHVPYAMVFEMTPEREGERLHLHGVIDTSSLDQGDRMRLSEALCKATSIATGAIGGLRQLEMVDLHNAPGWTDYLLKDATRTARELGIEHPFMLNMPMKREAKGYFEQLRATQGERLQGASAGASGLALTDRQKRKKVS